MIKYNKRNLYRHEVEDILSDCETKKDILDEIYGTYDNDYRSDTDLVIKRKWITRSKITLMNRINRLWVFPLFILSVPFTYLFFGQSKINEDSKIAKILVWLIGELN